MLALRRETAITCRDSVGYPRSCEKVHHSRPMPQCYPGAQCASGGQKTHPGSSGRPSLPRDHNAVPHWERLHLLHRAVSHHCTAAHCSVGSFVGNSKPREPSLKSTHGPNLPQPLQELSAACEAVAAEESRILADSAGRQTRSGISFKKTRT